MTNRSDSTQETTLRNDLLQSVAIAALDFDKGTLTRAFFGALTDKLLRSSPRRRAPHLSPP